MSEPRSLQFVDTNILIYAHDVSAGRKHTRAKELMRDLWQSGEGCLSIQVLQEFYVNVTQKVSKPLPTEAAAQMKLDLFNKETRVADNKRAIRLLRDADIFVEAQFIVGLDNETPETLEETYQMAWDWQPDLANWSMYTPWPFTPLFQEIRDQVEVFDFSKYNFVTPIMKPKALTRGELLNGVMKNYRRFYMKKALFHYPWRGTGFRRRYLLGCLRAFLKAGVQRTFYDLGKVGYWGPQTKGSLDFHFDETKQLAEAQVADWEAVAERSRLAGANRRYPGPTP